MRASRSKFVSVRKQMHKHQMHKHQMHKHQMHIDKQMANELARKCKQANIYIKC
jgi:hypothetical protein